MIVTCALASIALATLPLSQSGPLLTTTTPSLSIGQIRADRESFAAASLPLSMTDDRAWDIHVVRLPAVHRQVVSSDEKLYVRDINNDWMELSETTPILIAAGAPTDANGTLVTVAVRVTATRNSGVGERHGILEFRAAGVAPLDVDYDYEVTPTLTVSENAELPLSGLDPTKPGTYPFVLKSYFVQSNVPWVLEIVLRTPLATKDANQTIPDERLVILPAEGQLPTPLPLKVQHPVRVASGDKTGEAGTLVQFKIGFANTTREVAGTYNAEIEAVLRQNGASPP